MHNMVKSVTNTHCVGAAIISFIILPFAPLWMNLVPTFFMYLYFSVMSVTIFMPIGFRLLLMLSVFPKLLTKKEQASNLNWTVGRIITVKEVSRVLGISALESYYLLQCASKSEMLAERSSLKYECLKE